jgi:hypothetical protein
LTLGIGSRLRSPSSRSPSELSQSTVMLAYSSPKQATVPLVPHRLPHRIGRGTAGFRGGLHVEGGGSVSGERGALPVDAPSRDVDSRCRYRWSTSAERSSRSGLSAASYATRSTRRSNNEGGRRPVMSRPPEIGGFGDTEKRRELPP